jgi:hypothetical protein
MLGATTANVNAAGAGGLGSDILTTKITDSLDGADVYSAVAVLAAACNANPVIFLKYPPNYVFKGLGLTSESHGLSHRIGAAGMTGTCLDGVIGMLLKIDSYYTQKFTNLVSMLDGINEGDDTLLDHSAAVWFQEMSDGNAHNLNNLPIIQTGGLSGYFKTGYTVNVDGGSATLSQGNSESSCTTGTSTMVDGTTQSTGTDASLGNAPINKYFCNLMNAMGVMAGADGVPVKGGTQPVTNFGYSDKTEDFIHGGSNGSIHNPGEFTALRAGS